MAETSEKQAELWRQYSENKSPVIREKLILEYSPLVKFVAGRLSMYLGSHVDYDDLVSFGVFGLIDAIDKFDLLKGVKFETYASLRIRGAIIDSIREMDWAPRSLRQKSKEIEKLYSEVENELGHAASDKEMADRMGISVEEFSKTLNELNVSTMMSLDEFLEQNYEIGVDSNNVLKEGIPENYVEINELKETLANAINKLPDKEKMVISLYYYEELTLKEISTIMGVSESRISQLHTKSILRLRGKLSRLKSTLID